MPDNFQELSALLLQLEQRLFEAAIRRNPSAVESLLAEDFREFGISGRIYNRQQVIDELVTESPRHITLSHPVCQQLAEGVVLLNYRSTRTTPFEPAVHANRSSLWVNREGRWQIVFHQGTRV
jgi:hypothetical protein